MYIKICKYRTVPFNIFISILPVFSFIFINGCTDISDLNYISEKILTTESTSTDNNVIYDTSSYNYISEESLNAQYTKQVIKNDGEESDYSESYSTYTFTDSDEKLISSMIFVGDSICTGIPMLNKSQTLAQTDASSKNIMDIKFKMENGETDVLAALVNADPEIVIISLGMNDLNVLTENDFCRNYIRFISMIRTYCPDSHVIALSIAPVREDNEFFENSSINKFNNELKKAVNILNDNEVRYLDISPELKNSNGELKSKYISNDSIRLTDAAYYAILWQICGALKE